MVTSSEEVLRNLLLFFFHGLHFIQIVYITLTQKEVLMKQKRLQSVALALLLAGTLAFTGMFATTANAAAEKFTVTRLSGARREDVAKKVSDTFFTKPTKADRVILVNDLAFADAISSTNNSQGQYPILYTHKESMPEATAKPYGN